MEENFQKPKSKEYLSFWGLGITILVIVLVSIFFDMNSVKNWVENAGVWAPLVFILLKISTIVIAPLSGSPLYPLVGLLFGFWPGILYIALGDLLGYTIAFYISRIFGQKVVLKFIADKEEGILGRVVLHVSNGRGFFQACLALFAAPELLSYGAGLSRLSYLKFISILFPISMAAASILVLFGSLLEIKGESLLFGLFLPIFGGIVILVGGTLFLKAMNKK